MKKIGNFFVRIWKWIAKTAWIQPLLIVGLVFGVIFSIPPIVSAVQNSMNKKSSNEFLNEKIKTLEGITKTDVSKSAAGQLVTNIAKALDTQEDISGASEKFFLAFTQEGCAGCSDLADSAEYLYNNWGPGKNYVPDVTGERFELYTIKADEEIDNTDNLMESDSDDRKFDAFYTLLLTSDLGEILLEAAAIATERDYYFNEGGDDSTYAQNLEKMVSYSMKDFQTPLVILFDFTEAAREESYFGIREVFFAPQNAYKYHNPNDPNPNDVAGKAAFLMEAWNGTGYFGEGK